VWLSWVFRHTVGLRRQDEILLGRGRRVVGEVRVTERLRGREAHVGIEGQNRPEQRNGILGRRGEDLVEGDGGRFVPLQPARAQREGLVVGPIGFVRRSKHSKDDVELTNVAILALEEGSP
jgi:hypothetical protein